MLELFSYSLSQYEVVILVLVAVLVGMAKTGVGGTGMIVVPLLALVFGGKESTGIMLPIFIFGDFFGVYHYSRHADWHHLRQLLPYAMVGILIGTVTGDNISDEAFTHLMAIIIFVSVAIMIWQERKKDISVPDSKWFVAIIGILGGFTTMVGNLAGPVLMLYLLAVRLPKNEFIGTAAWFFLVINLLKVPFHIFAWQTITLNTILLDLCLVPAIALGAYLGIRIVNIIPEKNYRWFIILMTGIAAIGMLA